MSRASAFKQADLTRALRAGRDAGLNVARYEIEPSGKIVILTAGDDARPSSSNEWDEVLHGPQTSPAR